jgi:hypothetical protein
VEPVLVVGAADQSLDESCFARIQALLRPLSGVRIQAAKGDASYLG